MTRFGAVLPPDVDPERIPAHVACVMDGNGRWATRRGLKRTDGHAAGEEALFDAVEGALELGHPLAHRLRLLHRELAPAGRRGPLPDGVQRAAAADAGETSSTSKGVRVRFIGRQGWRVPKRVQKHIDDTEAMTAHNRRMTLTFAFNYGGRAEIVDAVQALVAEGTPADKITEKAIRSRLYAPDMPDPDLVVRTSGEYRISNFLLWEMAYSELIFTETLWPDFRREHLFEAVARVPAPRPPLRRRRPVDAPHE